MSLHEVKEQLKIISSNQNKEEMLVTERFMAKLKREGLQIGQEEESEALII